MTAAVSIERVSKSYSIYNSPALRLWEALLLQKRKFHQDFWALQDLSLEIRRGEGFALLGENGSGKSTLLQLIAGILEPTTGSIVVRGRLAALLELGSGFNPEFSGRENVFMNAAILGLTTREIEQRYPVIESFADIGTFIDQPVRTYSSGMTLRLAFAVAIHCEPDILLVDEALAVGDLAFRDKCIHRMKDLQAKGTSIVVVSHSPAEIFAFCDRALWLDKGKARQLGPAERVTQEYLGAMAERDQRYMRTHQDEAEPSSFTPAYIPETVPQIDDRRGNGAAEIVGIAVLSKDGRQQGFLEEDRPAILRIVYKAHRSVARPVIGFVLRNHLGVDFYGTDSELESCQLDPMQPGMRSAIDFRIEIPRLYASTFSFSVWLKDRAQMAADALCDSIENALTVHMLNSGKPVYGYVHVPCRVSTTRVEPLVREAQGASIVGVA